MKWITEISIIILGCIYIYLLDSPINSLVLWIYLALIYNLVWSIRLTAIGKSKTPAFWGFMVGSNLFMLFVHITWFFDISGAKTGSSTSALIFMVTPIWSFIFGGIAGGLCKFTGMAFSKTRKPETSLGDAP